MGSHVEKKLIFLDRASLNRRHILGFQPGMRAIAKRGFFTVFASAPGHLLLLFQDYLDGRKISSGVGPIAEWLSF
jgi:hypothetical protein